MAFTQKPNLFSSSSPEPKNVFWSTVNLTRIKEFVAQHGPDIAVFDADGTLWADDIGEAFFKWLIVNKKLKNVDYSKDLFREYENRVDENTIEGYKWLVSIMAGISEIELKQWADDFFKTYFPPLIFEGQKKLIALLRAKNYDIWIVSASNQWIIKAGAKYLGIPENHAIGVQLVVENGILTDKIAEPFTYQQGKVDAIKKYIGKQPGIVVGDSEGDLPMLAYAKYLHAFIAHNAIEDQELITEAKHIGCLIQFFPLQPPMEFENSCAQLLKTPQIT